jgi:DNA-binding transcriptional LysR family regulator
MDRFQEMKVFVAVVDNGSFVRAADALKSSKAAVSRLLADLERRLGARLLNRTTRRLSLTDDGKMFYARCTELLHALEEAESELNTRTGEAAGHLRVTAPVTFGNNLMAPLWGDFLAQHPKVSLDVNLSDRTADLVEEGLDLAVRIARAPHPVFIARKLASTRMVLCASPEYLAKNGTPSKPQDLAEHEVVSYTYWSSRDEWEFKRADGIVETVKTRPRMHANSGDTCVAAALKHHGIVMQPDFLLFEALRSGALVRLLPDYEAVELGIYAVYASRRQLPLKLRYLIDFLVESFRNPVWNDY